jgi:hypothetical protein
MRVIMPSADPAQHDVWERPVAYVVVPVDLADKLFDVLSDWFDPDDVRVVVERRSGADRRQAGSAAPAGVERRLGDRRLPARAMSAADAGIELPRAARRHAGRILVVEDLVPVHHRDEAVHAANLVSRVRAGDAEALDQLDRWLQPVAHRRLAHLVRGRDQHAVTREAVDDVLARAQDPAQDVAVAHWLSEATAVH